MIARARSTQSGISIIVALFVLVAMALLAVAIVRSTDTATLVSGGLAFKQSARQQASAGTEVALASVAALASREASAPVVCDSSVLVANNNGCYSANLLPPNSEGVPTVLADSPTPSGVGDPNTGHTVRYVVERLCNQTGPATAANCTMFTRPTRKSGTMDPSRAATGGDSVPYYRATVRVDGPRRTLTYVQTVFHF
jgi:type IV pilus assembly protein PilX